jgi:hypothetical protein
MNQTHKDKNNLSEYQKALNFLKEGCECGCSSTVYSEEFARLRENFQKLSKKERDAFVMGQLFIMKDRELITSSPRLKKTERTNKRTFYLFDYTKPVCLKTYLNLLGVSRNYLEYMKTFLTKRGLITRVHGNINRKPQWITKMTIDEITKAKVKKFLENYAQEHGQPDPSQKYARKIVGDIRTNGEIIFLPTETTYKSVHHDFVISFGEENDLKSLKYEAFRRLWHKLVPKIKIRNPRSDLCDTCHKFRNEIHACQDETMKETQKKNFLNTEPKPN